MKPYLSTGLILIALIITACNEKREQPVERQSNSLLSGTWKLQTGTLIENGDTVVTDYTKGRSFIKIINATHFAFLNHDLSKGKDSLSVFGAGGGTYTFKDNTYTEHLEYCSDRSWEGNDFSFQVNISNDTLIQSGTEKIESEGINRINIERYVKLAD